MSKRPSNRAIIASAGSGKTTNIVEQALLLLEKRVLITTYTNENLEQINSYLIQKNGYVPDNITVLSWYSFLLQDGVRPYQNLVTQKGRANSILFDELPDSSKFTKKSNVDRYFMTGGNNIYRDRVADFVCSIDDASNGLVIKRLEQMYDYIFVDEIQDLAGYDLNILEKLLSSSISILAVGDPRQATFSTNRFHKNKQFKKAGIYERILQEQKRQLLSIEEKTESYRCGQKICDFADMLFPDLPKTISKNIQITSHDGIFHILENDVPDYIEKYNPKILRFSKAINTMNLPALNIGLSKGRTYERVLIFPTKPMIKYLKSLDISEAGDKEKLYIAITRAKYSAAFVVPNDPNNQTTIRWMHGTPS